LPYQLHTWPLQVDNLIDNVCIPALYKLHLLQFVLDLLYYKMLYNYKLYQFILQKSKACNATNVAFMP